MASPVPTQDQELAVRIVSALRSRMSALLDAVVRHIRDEVPAYGRAEVVPPEDLRVSVTNNIDYVLGGLTEAGSVDVRVPLAMGRVRAAQGAPLVDMLSAYRVGFRVLWSELVTTARAIPGVTDTVLGDLAGVVFALHNDYCDAAISAYRDEAQQIARARERERAVLVEAILTGSTTRGTLWEVAQALRLPLDGVFVVVVGRARLGHDPMPRVESALAVHDISSVWRLETDLSLGVVSLGDRSRTETALTALRRHASGPVGVSPVFVELRQAAWALRLARLALDRRQQRTGVEQFLDRPLDVLLAAAPHAALETARVMLGGLLELPTEDRELLLATFEAWVDAGGSAQEASTVLFCHPNTVRYRLRRIEAETGRSLSDPADAAELVTAARAWSQLPHSTSN